MWLYEGTAISGIDDIPNSENVSYQGFVYKITNIATGKFYIGKKSFISNQKKKMTQKELADWNKPGKRPTHKRVVKESDWFKYWGSNKTLLAEIKANGESGFKREILKLCKTKKQLTYWEIHFQCLSECLTQPERTYNDNILGKFFTRDLL
jgi:kynurenine formamidase